MPKASSEDWIAEVISVPPRSTVLHAPIHNTPVFLTGRRSIIGYPGHIWTHGLDFAERESEIKRVYAGTADAEAILRKYGVDYAVIGPLERNLMSVNDRFFSRYELVGEDSDFFCASQVRGLRAGQSTTS